MLYERIYHFIVPASTLRFCSADSAAVWFPTSSFSVSSLKMFGCVGHGLRTPKSFPSSQTSYHFPESLEASLHVLISYSCVPMVNVWLVSIPHRTTSTLPRPE